MKRTGSFDCPRSIHSLVRSHFSIIRLLRTARFALLGSFARSFVCSLLRSWESDLCPWVPFHWVSTHSGVWRHLSVPLLKRVNQRACFSPFDALDRVLIRRGCCRETMIIFSASYRANVHNGQIWPSVMTNQWTQPLISIIFLFSRMNAIHWNLRKIACERDLSNDTCPLHGAENWLCIDRGFQCRVMLNMFELLNWHDWIGGLHRGILSIKAAAFLYFILRNINLSILSIMFNEYTNAR